MLPGGLDAKQRQWRLLSSRPVTDAGQWSLQALRLPATGQDDRRQVLFAE
jgi:hypothetical protein